MDNTIRSSPLASNSRAPIFIVGCQRSVTSLMRKILDSHSNIACPPESSFIVKLAGVYEVERCIRSFKDMGFTEADVLGQMQIFSTYFFQNYARSKGKRRWADKMPYYMDHLDTIDLMFKEEVLYIGMIRHGLDVAYSLCDFDWSVLRPYLTDGIEKPVAAIRFWRDQNTKLLGFKDKVKERFCLLRYEDLTVQPRQALEPVFEFLEEPWEEAVLNYNEFEHDPGFGDPKMSKYKNIQPNSGNYKNRPLGLQRRVYQEAHTLFERLGYRL